MIAAPQTLETQIPLILRLLENALRSGYNVKQALELATEELSTPALTDIQQVLAEMNSGTSPLDALDHWLKRTPSADLNLVVATFRVQMEVGGNLADKLKLLGQILEKRSAL